jgi:hypothetical protein
MGKKKNKGSAATAAGATLITSPNAFPGASVSGSGGENDDMTMTSAIEEAGVEEEDNQSQQLQQAVIGKDNNNNNGEGKESSESGGIHVLVSKSSSSIGSPEDAKIAPEIMTQTNKSNAAATTAENTGLDVTFGGNQVESKIGSSNGIGEGSSGEMEKKRVTFSDNVPRTSLPFVNNEASRNIPSVSTLIAPSDAVKILLLARKIMVRILLPSLQQLLQPPHKKN